MLLIAAGIGITSMRALLRDAPYAPGEAALIYRFREHAIFIDELNTIASRRGPPAWNATVHAALHRAGARPDQNK
jgi:ferredoxin-NADP reductase